MIDAVDKIGRDELLSKDNIGTLGAYTALAVIPARYAIERADWKAAAALPVVPTKRAAADSLIRFTRGLGMARTGDSPAPSARSRRCRSWKSALEMKPETLLGGRSEEQILAVINAWVAFAEGSRDEALKFMRGAAENEDGSIKHVAMENRLYPMRELYGDLLLEHGQQRLHYASSKLRSRKTPIATAGSTAPLALLQAVGEKQKAADYFAKLVKVAEKADSDRAEIAQAKMFLAKN